MTEPLPGLVPTVEHQVTEVTEVTVRGRRLRVAVRPASGPGLARTPLLLMNGLGARLEVLEPLVDQLPLDLEVIRFDVPGVGGSPAPLLPYHFAMLASLVGALVRRLGHERVDVLGYSWGRRAGAAVRGDAGAQVQAARARGHRYRRGHGARQAPRAGAHAHPAPLPRPGLRESRREPSLRRHDAHPPRARGAGAAHTRALRLDPRLRVPAAGHRGLDEPARPAPHPAATLVLSGDDDPIIPTINARIMARGIPRARLHLYRGGHLALVTEAAELAPVIDAFLAAR